MGSNQHPVEVDQQVLTDAKKLWGNFTEAAKFGIIGVAIILVLMAFFLV